MPQLHTPTTERRAFSDRLDLTISALMRNSRVAVFSLLALGFVVRIWHASGTYFHPDEALHFFIANKNSWAEMYSASRSLSHPPLLIFILYFWRSLGSSELVLRLPSIFAGTAFCWLTFKWLAKVFAPGIAWTGFVLALFLPSSIDLSTEVRQYALLLAFCTASAYLLELGFEKDSGLYMFGSGMFLWLAICSHYSSFLFAAVLGVYALSRMARHQPSLPAIAAWEAGQVIAFGLAYFFYVSHIATLGQNYAGANATRGWMANSYLPNSYYVPGKISPLLFVLARSGGVFQYIFGQSVLGDLGFLAFAAGVVLSLKTSTARTRFQLSSLLVLPFALNCAAALLRFYPYGGTRHSAFLIPFAIAGISIAIAKIPKSTASAIVVAALICAIGNLLPSHRDFLSKDHRLRDMTAAINFINQDVPATGRIFADYQTSLMLGYYLCDHQPESMNHSIPGFLTYSCGGHGVISTDWTTDIFTAQTFVRQWPQLRKQFQLEAGSEVWVAQMGPPGKLNLEIAPLGVLISDHAFGRYIHIFSVKAGATFSGQDQSVR